MFDNIAFSFFGISIYWYGLVYFFGFLIAYLTLLKLDKFLKVKKEVLEEIFLYTSIFGLIGARAFHIIFYNPIFYIQNPIEIIFVNKGGMSIFGGIFIGLITIQFLCKKHKINFFKLSDLVCIILPLFLSFGRIANHLNKEIVGTITNSSFGVKYLNKDDFLRYPIVLFESFFYQIIFQINFFLYSFLKLKKGTITLIFIFSYSTIRFFLEFLKESTKIFFIINMSQIFCIIFFLYGVYLIKKSRFIKYN